MGEESLFEIYLREEVEDLKLVLLKGGVNILLSSFTFWLKRNELMVDDERISDFKKEH